MIGYWRPPKSHIRRFRHCSARVSWWNGSLDYMRRIGRSKRSLR